MTKDEMQEVILGVAVVALVYAVYQHRKAATAGVIRASDQAAIDTAIASGASDGPPIFVPEPIPIQSGKGGYTYDDGSGFWADLFKGVL